MLFPRIPRDIRTEKALFAVLIVLDPTHGNVNKLKNGNYSDSKFRGSRFKVRER